MTIETAAHVGPDGRLEVSLPSQYANSDVILTVRPANGASVEGRTSDERRPQLLEDSRHFVRRFAGTWEGEPFSRPDQGVLEERDELQ
jgi:hypothetical protein